MKKETVLLIFSILILSVLFCALIERSEQKEREMFREELIWYSKYQVIEEMYLNGLSEGRIYEILLFEIKEDWTPREITENLRIIKSY